MRGAEVARGRSCPATSSRWTRATRSARCRGVPTTEPAFGLPATWIADAARAEAEALGYTVVDRESVIVTHLTETIRAPRRRAAHPPGDAQLLDRLKETNAAVVEEVVPDVLSLGEIQRVLQALLREGVSIRDLGAIVEAIGDKARLTRDPALLAEYARQALGRTITAPHLDAERTLRAIALDPAIEQEVGESIAQTPDGEYLAMEPVARPGAGAALDDAARARRSPAAAGRCCSARPASAATCGGSASRRCRSWPSAPTTRSCPASASRPWELSRHESTCDRRPDATEPTTQDLSAAASLEELLPQIREELGPDAIIMRQREGLMGGIGGFFQKQFVEVEAKPGGPRIDVYDEPPVGARRASRRCSRPPPTFAPPIGSSSAA